LTHPQPISCGHELEIPARTRAKECLPADEHMQAIATDRSRARIYVQVLSVKRAT
jgi:hypothetical protein